MSSTERWTPPREFHEYRLVRLLGHGAMGLVYLAQDTVLERPVAVKFLSATEPDPRTRERFRVEAKAAARIQHPNIMAIHRIGELERRPYLVTEYIRGQSLSALELPLPWREALELGIGLARGLAAAHRKGVLHRDIKLANAILSDDGVVKLLDFSLAKLVDTRAASQSAPVSAASGDDAPVEPPADVEATAGTIERADTEPRGIPEHDAEGKPARLAARIKSSMADTVKPITAQPDLLESGPQLARALEQLGEGPLGDLTREGVLMGTPHYMAPELWRAEVATRRSDVYALGALLHFLCTGGPPFPCNSAVDLAMTVQRADARPVAELVPGIEPRFAAIIDRCLRRLPAQRFRSGEELRSALEEVTAERRTTAVVARGNPYRGLQAFEAEHREFFFGREVEIRSVVERLRSSWFVLVAGDSGVGKSSLCRAGVLPLIGEGPLDPERAWTTSPMIPGRHPLQVLLAALLSGLELEDEVAVRDQLVAEPAGLERVLRRALGKDRGRLLFVDQLEELVTIADPQEAAIVGALLTRIADGIPGVRLLATVRGDFLTRVARVPELGATIEEAVFLLRPMASDNLRRAVAGPAQTMDVGFETDELVDELVAEGIKGSLPLLQFALAELWEVRDRKNAIITRAGLEQIGGVTGALARHADDLLARLLATQRVAARRLLLKLVTIEDTRASLPEDELVGGDEAARAALEALVQGRLLVARESEDEAIYEIAHEALINGWKTLRQWLDEEQETREVRKRLEGASAEWERLKRPDELLWSPQQLSEAEQLDVNSLGPRERAFQAASWLLDRKRRWRRRALIGAVPVLGLLAYAGFRVQAYVDTRARIAHHVELGAGHLERALAARREYDALRERAYRRFDAQDEAAGEDLWARARALLPTIEDGFVAANQQYEAALILDSAHERTANALGELIFERAVFAADIGHEEDVSELLSRLDLYDVAGAWKRRWEAPAHLSIIDAPPDTEVSLETYEFRVDGELVPSAPRALGVTPLSRLDLSPGSYRLTFEVPGRAPVLYPVALTRGEEVTVALDLPAGPLPDGFVYVPAGRFLYGSRSAEELRRGMLNAVPIHPVELDAYLIARHETTYGQWIEFLESLPPEERARRAPNIEGNPFQKGLRLERLEDGAWQFTLVADPPKVARVGEPIVYAERTRNKSHDWTRLPVGGVRWDDVLAFTAWLDRTGRVPNARPCSEYEWVRAARGADRRTYPAGDRLLAEDANFDETYGQSALTMGPDEVGAHPRSRSPFGVDDLVGNNWEWLVSSQVRGQVAIRGGGYDRLRLYTRIDSREGVPLSDFADGPIGFRVCASPPR
ncbi:MAG: protein kinase [Nannocystaceae bacterium]|nr:protein kinase [Myxococcales bacterium]